MSVLNVANANITVANTVFLTVNGTAVDESISVGNVTINTTSLKVGANVTVNGSGIFAPRFNLGGVNYFGVGPYGAIVNTQIFTTTGWSQWTNPTANSTLALTGNERVLIMMWGGGGGGLANSTVGALGGGGGACVVVDTLTVSQLNSVCNVFVGAGGAANTLSNGLAGTGQTSVFWANTTLSISAYGGGGAAVPLGGLVGGGGGGLLGLGGNSGVGGGAPLGGAVGVTGGDSTFGGGGGANSTGPTYYGGRSIFGGGGGGATTIVGLQTIYGGAAGDRNSVFGGDGGTFGVAGRVPGGGGWAAGGSNAPTAGARGEVRVWVIK